MNQHYKALGKAVTDPFSKPYVGVSKEDWRYMIDHVFLGDTHKVINSTLMNVYLILIALQIHGCLNLL